MFWIVLFVLLVIVLVFFIRSQRKTKNKPFSPLSNSSGAQTIIKHNFVSKKESSLVGNEKKQSINAQKRLKNSVKSPANTAAKKNSKPDAKPKIQQKKKFNFKINSITNKKMSDFFKKLFDKISIPQSVHNKDGFFLILQKIPNIGGKQCRDALEKLNFELNSQRGYFKDTVTVLKINNQILKKADISDYEEHFLKILLDADKIKKQKDGFKNALDIVSQLAQALEATILNADKKPITEEDLSVMEDKIFSSSNS